MGRARWTLATLLVASTACSGRWGGTTQVLGSDVDAGGVTPSGTHRRIPIILLVGNGCPDPTSEYACGGGIGCCPLQLFCCDSGPNAGSCAPDCNATYDTSGDECVAECSDEACCPEACAADGTSPSSASCTDPATCAVPCKSDDDCGGLCCLPDGTCGRCE